ncbi:MAG: hypothetical protein LBP96_02245, partial [Bacteroidales bacterium]|nr:hypothetical protein [Bacteroidales bacterium]
MKTIKFIGALVALSLVLTACTKDLLPEFVGVIDNAPTTEKMAKAGISIPDLPGVKDLSRNSSAAKGEVKISSHSHALPQGVVFNWSMHKNHNADRGYLKISKALYEASESITITLQQSNT